ncbi:zf-HC2 domain-containing protein [Nitrogeniibacter mangrovi]|uniref:Zf-HC2 domain-containing protein n=1 Tax=Nitrogeniibacter mangrovi TaxID=2016596 RepID=A0A6C1B3L2_9RHOO|nr:zf-HC2 domain-containing protein [Nitrogeniibacter mangrovi]QID18251.1 zf-HC2 domain-containing protein [Nitrogeniibacter mangrovi]
MLSCKDATRLMSEARDRDLSLRDRLRLRLHLAICAGCANFDKQMDFLRRACRGYLKRNDFTDES